jgi:hypothetical protein
MGGLTAAQWSLVSLLITGAIKAGKLAIKGLENARRVAAMTDEEVSLAIEKEEARSKELDQRLDAH